MFFGCSFLQNLNLSSFNTEKVTDMYYMFYGCSSLSYLNLYYFNTKNTTVMENMFSNCSSLSNRNIITNDIKISQNFQTRTMDQVKISYI